MFAHTEDPGGCAFGGDLMLDGEDEEDSTAGAGSSPSSALLGADVSFTGLYPSKAHGAELKIEVQPEPQHR